MMRGDCDSAGDYSANSPCPTRESTFIHHCFIFDCQQNHFKLEDTDTETFTMSSMREYLKVQSSLIDSFFKMSCKVWGQKPFITMAIHNKKPSSHWHSDINYEVAMYAARLLDYNLVLLDTLILFINPKLPLLKTHREILRQCMV